MIEPAGSTWAGTHAFGASRLHTPTSVTELQDIVATARNIRALGTRHSFNDLADSAELVTLVDLKPEFALDPGSMTVSVASGTRFGILARWLNEQGYALHNLGSLPHISIAGATATSTHGSGSSNGTLATAVAGIDIVTASGELASFDRTYPDFGGMVPSLGALGVITRVTLDIEPTYQVRQDVYPDVPWDAIEHDLDAVMAAGYSVSLFTTWAGPTIEQLWVKSRLVDGQPATMPDTLFGSRPTTANASITLADDNTTIQGGVPGPWSERLPHFRLDRTPSSGKEIQSEYFVALEDGAPAIAALRKFGADIAQALIVSELRTVAADNLWLSMSTGRSSLAIHFTWKDDLAAVRTLLPRVERALAPFAARPHWGKVFEMDGSTIRSLYPRGDDFATLATAMDPNGKFRNHYTTRVLGLPGRTHA